MNDIVKAKIDLAAHKVAPLFKLFGWTWVNEKPDYNEIYQHIYDLVEEILSKPDTELISCGRITVRKCNDGMTDSIEISLDLETIYEYEFKEKSND